jgi:hypothetical protein
MNGFTKTLSAALLTAAVLGGTGALLASSLATPQTKVTVEGVSVEPAAKKVAQADEFVTVTATRRAS